MATHFLKTDDFFIKINGLGEIGDSVTGVVEFLDHGSGGVGDEKRSKAMTNARLSLSSLLTNGR